MLPISGPGTVNGMTQCPASNLPPNVRSGFRASTAICGLFLLLATSLRARGEPTAAALSAFDSYAGSVESRLALQHSSLDRFLAYTQAGRDEQIRLRRGELILERITPSEDAKPGNAALAGAMIHHWRGTAFVPGATVADFERMMRDVSEYPHHFSPQVLSATLLAQFGDALQVSMRVRQRHVITVVLDTDYEITYGQLDAHHGYSVSRSTKISEIGAPGTKAEHALSSNEEHGFLWRLNTYWSYQEKDGGLYMQIESVSLTRSIPTGLGWAIGPYVESVPRESLEFTLRSVCNVLRK